MAAEDTEQAGKNDRAVIESVTRQSHHLPRGHRIAHTAIEIDENIVVFHQSAQRKLVRITDPPAADTGDTGHQQRRSEHRSSMGPGDHHLPHPRSDGEVP